jgi:hypothetical protein
MVKPYIFQDVFIHLFDINNLPNLLKQPEDALDNRPFKFLIRKEEYDQFQSSDSPIISEHFVLQRFPKTKLKDSALWRRYANPIFGEKKPSLWNLQVPFYLR